MSANDYIASLEAANPALLCGGEDRTLRIKASALKAQLRRAWQDGHRAGAALERERVPLFDSIFGKDRHEK